ncbi:MAG: M42 family metallopeptidase [Chloroflexi bacterium]|nr:M42 family metallopeptidase [Chloroflexota bacterium]
MPRVERLLEELSNAHGPSGSEGPVRKIVQRELAPLCDELETDGVGSLIARLGEREGTPRIMLAAHMDEVGLMVRYITPEGYVKFQGLGGVLDQALINQRWAIVTGKGVVYGVTGIKTTHVMTVEARTQLFRREQMFIDVGASSKQDAEERLGIRPGDPVAPDSKFMALNGSKVYLGKAWDDRAGVGVMIEVMRNLRGRAPKGAVYAAATVQEEVGLRGAHTSTYKVHPDIGINLESGVAGDYPGTNMDEAQEKLGEGPGLFLHDSSMLPNLKLRDFVLDVARELEIPVQFNVLAGYGQDGSEMQRGFGGVPVINLTVPTRYLHSHNGLMHRDDFDRAVALATEVVRRLDGPTVEGIRSFEQS